MKRLAVVAVETNLLGRIAVPPAASDSVAGHLWPFRLTKDRYLEEQAEVVSAFVGDLEEGGTIKFVLRGLTSGRLAICYDHAFLVKEASQ